MMTTNADVEALRQQRKAEIVLGYRLLASWGWGDDGSGHITGRDPEHQDHFWLLRYRVAFGAATVDDLVLVGPDGTVAEPDAHGNSAINGAAYLIHAPIHAARPDIVGVVHAHTPYGTPFAAQATPLLAMSQEACAFHNRQSIFLGEELDVCDIAVGRRIAANLGDGRLIILANHGLLTVGASVGEAFGFFVLAERSAEVQVKSPLGRVVSDAAAEKVYKSIGTPANGEVVFEWLVRSRLTQ